MSADSITTRRNSPHKTNWSRWKNSKTLFDDCCQIGKLDELLKCEIFLRLEVVTDFLGKSFNDMAVIRTKDLVEETGEKSSGCLCPRNAKITASK
jgi:hypothetical protein